MIYEHVVKRPRPVRAVQWTGFNWPEILRFVGPPVADERNTKPSPGWTANGYFEISIEDSNVLMVPTLHGRVEAQKGSWILQGPKDFWPVDEELFKDDYAYGTALAELDQEEVSDEWAEAYDEGCRDMEKAIPPILRRFFWWDKDSLTSPWKLIYRGGDEFCNNTLGVRVKGGVFFIRTDRKFRTEPNPNCPKCGGNAS